MKKINTNRLIALLAALCLVTSCFVGSTLAKYITTGTGTDTARVAKWGVTITANGETFADEYDTDDEAVKATITKSVVSTEKVVAPGTAGELSECAITGTPEVAVNVAYAADLKLTGWKVDDTEYCPIIFKVNETEIKQKTTLAQLETDVENAIAAYSKDYGPGQDLSVEGTVATPDVSWEWPFYVSDENDLKDTALGDQAAGIDGGTASKISLEVKTTVTQID